MKPTLITELQGVSFWLCDESEVWISLAGGPVPQGDECFCIAGGENPEQALRSASALLKKAADKFDRMAGA